MSKTIIIAATAEGNLSYSQSDEEQIIITSPVHLWVDSTSVSFRIDSEVRSMALSDNITISGSAFSGTLTELKDAFEALLPASGSGGSGAAILQSAGNGTKWLLGVTDLGAAQTIQTDEGSPTVLYRWSLNGTKWYFGVNDVGGVLTVEESKNYANDTEAAAEGIPIGGLYHTDGFVKIRTV